MSEQDIEGRSAARLAALQPAAAAAGLAAFSSPAGRDPIDRVACRLGDTSCAGAHASAMGRAQRSAHTSAQAALLRLQRSFGNRYVGQMLLLSRARDDSADGMDAVEHSIGQARGGGQGLDHGTRAQMETAFGADFGAVRVHTDARADGLNHSLSARAFATGHDVFFRQGEYNPGSSGGRELLAHELTHVVQQTGGGIQRKMTVSEPNDPQEVEADQMARAVMQQEQGAAVQRQPEALKPGEEEENKGLSRQVDVTQLARQEDEQVED